MWWGISNKRRYQIEETLPNNDKLQGKWKWKKIIWINWSLLGVFLGNGKHHKRYSDKCDGGEHVCCQLQFLHQLAIFIKNFIFIFITEDNIPVIMVMVFLGGIIQRFLASPPTAEGAHSAPTKHDCEMFQIILGGMVQIFQRSVSDFFRINVSDCSEKCFRWIFRINQVWLRAVC